MNTNELKNLLVSQLRRIDGRTSPWSNYEFNCSLHDEVYPELRFFDDINSFPTVCFVVSNERVLHAEGSARFYSVSLELRGYTYDEDVEESGELLAQDVEHVLAYLRREDSRLEDIRLLETNTDSGLNAPWGACILNIEALFRR
jgi:hypothetical protein